MTDPLKWDTRLTVVHDGKPITPIDSFNPTFASPTVPLHSLEADNVGYVVQPQTFTFTMAVKAVGPAVAKLTDLARRNEAFTLSLTPEHGNDWSFANVAFNSCYITQIANSVVIDGVPTTTFTCICLEVLPTAAGGGG
jgi:hypothetical protein